MHSKSNTPKKLPRVCLGIYLLGALSLILYLAFRLCVPFADFFNGTVGAFCRRLMAYLTVWIPFSFAELLLLSLPILLILLIVLAYRRYCDSRRSVLVFLGILLSLLLSVAILFVWTFAAGYFGTPLAEKLELERKKVSKEELSKTASILADDLNTLSDAISFSDSGSSTMPYSISEMNQKLLDAYDRVHAKYPFIDTFYSKAKPVLLSEPMSYTHITGVYTFFTGEANINVHFPDYTIPFTAAHELAHQRGIAREDEANFVAFLVCMESEDSYIRYSGTLSVYEYVASALYSADRELYKQSYASLCREIQGERAAYRVFFEKYRDNVAASVSQSVNNGYLTSQGAPEGTRSYNLVVDLTVAYYRAIFLS
ncbi:MAG: DUF3810 domain-containing protein [Clostridia bacterium]|nr:DUF3810 domain-containing protein [Clostridia bacterium]